jgi:hypothetical protein
MSLKIVLVIEVGDFKAKMIEYISDEAWGG